MANQKGPRRIFVSYARRDGAELALRLQQDLTSNGFDAWLDTQRLQSGAVWSREIEHEIDTSQITIALLSPGSYASEICRAEQLRALDKGNRVIPVLAVKGADRPLYLYARQYRDFSDGANYATHLNQLIADIRGSTTASLPENYRRTRVTYLTAPPRVPNYQERTEAMHALRNVLFAEDNRQPIALTALAGMGGIGKTVLAKALTDDEVVQRAFPDGIVWITAGKERKRDFLEEMREVAKALGDDLSAYDTALGCQHQYRTTIANRAALIVVDDVWSKADIEPLLAESLRSRFLFTTRDASIGRFVSAREHRVELLDLAQSRELLAAWAHVPVAQLPAAADEIVRECGHLPLALSLVGAMLRSPDVESSTGADEKFWQDTLELLRKSDLSAIEEQLPQGQQSFFKAVQVSFESLKPEMRQRYKALAVLLEEMSAPLPILETLWNVSEAEARRISRHFVDRSLAQREAERESLRLHDLQSDYVRSQYPDKDALGLVHSAMRLSSHVLAEDPRQFASQMVGRLMRHAKQPAVGRLVSSIVAGAPRPWLRPQWPSFHQSGGNLLRTLQGHSGLVIGVAVTPDGRRVVSASSDKTLKVWDLESGQELQTLQGHSNSVEAVAVTPDGRRAVSASDDTTLKVWDLENGQELGTLQGHSRFVRGVAVTPDGRRVVSASSDKTLKVWDLESGQELQTLQGHSDSVNNVVVTPDGSRAVSISNDKTLRVWNLKSSQELQTFQGHSDLVIGVAVTLDGRRAISTSYDTTLKVWDLERERELQAFQTRSHFVHGVAVTPNGKCAISAVETALKVWDLTGGQELQAFQAHSHAVNGVAVTADGRRAVSASFDKTLKVWDLESGQELKTLQGHSWSVTGVAVSPDGRRAVSVSWDRTLKVWDLESGQELETLQRHSDAVNGVAVTPDGRAISVSDKTLRLWDLESAQKLQTFRGHSGFVSGVAVTPDGRRVISASYDKTLRVWDLESGLELQTLLGHSNIVSGVAASPDGRHAVSTSYDKTLKVWDLESGLELQTLLGHSNAVSSVAVSPDGRRAVSTSRDNALKVWDLGSGEVLATFTLEMEAHCCAFASRTAIIAGDVGGRVYLLSLEE